MTSIPNTPRIDARVRVMSADVVGHIATAQERNGGWSLSVRLPDGEILTGVSAADCRYVNDNGTLGDPVWTPPRSRDDEDAVAKLKRAVRLGRAIHAGADPRMPVAQQIRQLAAATVAQGALLRGCLEGDAESIALAREILGAAQ